jgi:hypothetical protein
VPGRDLKVQQNVQLDTAKYDFRSMNSNKIVLIDAARTFIAVSARDISTILDTVLEGTD